MSGPVVWRGGLVLALAVGLAGCGRGGSTAGGWTVVRPTQLTRAQEMQQKTALAAREELFRRMVSRLQAVLTEKGPAEAIAVCQTDAPRIAGEVGKAAGVSIGRTSFSLRNPKNAPPEWAVPLVEKRVTDSTYLTHPDGRLAALLPIRLLPACVSCHGPADRIPADVRASLGTHYPDDAATGFAEGDLRGWFWVEVPAEQ